MKDKKKYVPYVYKCKGPQVIDMRTGCLAVSNPRVKGDGSSARLSR
jgi:hypothetical protein